MINLRYKYSLVDQQDHVVPCVVPGVLDSCVDDCCLLGRLEWVKTSDHNYFWVLMDYKGMSQMCQRRSLTQPLEHYINYGPCCWHEGNKKFSCYSHFSVTPNHGLTD